MRTSPATFDVEPHSMAWRREWFVTFGGTGPYRLLVARHEDVHRAYAGIVVPNPASVRLHEAFGFRHVGPFTEQGRKFGRYWDVAWYERPVPLPSP